MKALIVIPTFNEVENMGVLLPRLRALMPTTDILVVDDNSPDGTAAAVRQLQESDPSIQVLVRQNRTGFADASIAGLQEGLDRQYEAILQMDADLSHPPEVVPLILQALESADIVVGSRYVAGGGVENWAWHRRVISRLGNWYAQTLLGMPINDLTGGFVGWRRDGLAQIRISETQSKGYAFLIELKYRAFLCGLRFGAVPFVFPDRIHGQSKMTAAIFGEAFRNVFRLRLRKRTLFASLKKRPPHSSKVGTV